MEKQKKVVYEAPIVMVVEMKTEGIICGSNDPTAQKRDYESCEW